MCVRVVQWTDAFLPLRRHPEEEHGCEHDTGDSPAMGAVTRSEQGAGSQLSSQGSSVTSAAREVYADEALNG